MPPEADAKTAVDPADQAKTIADHALASTVVVSSQPAGTASVETLAEATFADRYELGTKLGEGGMGEVRLCKDRRVGREVAIKTVRKGTGSKGDLESRFLREARVQGQLEHPAVLPVYDLGRNPDGAAYFTMKRLRGMTFEEVVEKHKAGDPETVKTCTPRKLLTAFSSVCLAVHFAHMRGVLHRDLKPGNIMLGDFGEVYVLDWGLAKLRGADETGGFAPVAEGDGSSSHPRVTVDAVSSGAAHTLAGEAMGTPGYMAPEQARGEIASLDARADIYALGVILFEILAHEPLHGRGTVQALLTSTLQGGAERRFSIRVPQRELAPELEAIVFKATALDPADRFQTARELSDAVESYLDGDRDTLRRRELAAAHAESASRAAERALAAEGRSADEQRGDAMREISRALALDPGNARAIETLVTLVTTPPKEVPPEVKADLDERHGQGARTVQRSVARAYVAWLLLMPPLLLMGVRSYALLALGMGLLAASGLCAAYYGWFTKLDPRPRLPMLVLGACTIAFSATLFGPYIMAPGFAVQMMLTTSLSPGARRYGHVMLPMLAVLGPAALQAAGILPPSYVFGGDSISIVPHLASFPPMIAQTYLFAGTAALLLVTAASMLPLRQALTRLETHLALQAWQLRQFIPREAQAAATLASSESEPTCKVLGV